MTSNWFTDLFVDEAKKALEAREGYGSGSGSSGDEDGTYILVDESGNRIPAVMVAEETVFTATANDIREGTVAATEEGVTVGTKEIPAYIVSEGVILVMSGEEFMIPLDSKKCAYTELQAIFCKLGSSVATSVESDRVSMMDQVYNVNSNDVISTVTPDPDSGHIRFGISNDSGTMYVIRYFSYKEEY